MRAEKCKVIINQQNCYFMSSLVTTLIIYCKARGFLKQIAAFQITFAVSE
jgi:hypothetical protein